MLCAWQSGHRRSEERGLDFGNMNRVAKMLRELSKRKVIIVISHDSEFLNLVCTRITSL